MTKRKLVLATVSIAALLAVAWIVGIDPGTTAQAAEAPRGPEVGADPPESPAEMQHASRP